MSVAAGRLETGKLAGIYRRPFPSGLVRGVRSFDMGELEFSTDDHLD
jgi:hypothetical protein